MSWGAPHWLWALLTLPLLALLFVYAESKTAQRLREFVSPRLLPELAGTVDRLRRALRFALQLGALGLTIVALAQPRWGYVYDETKRKGLDLIVAIDTSRSMLSNDVQPNRLERVKLATQDLINELQGDRVGLIAFAGRAFVQAPLTIDYDATIESISDLDTKTIPEGGTNISEAINLAVQTYGKSATGNRALVLFTDGEELSGDAVKTAKAAADAGVKIFTIGVGTPEGSLIPVPNDSGGGTEFVKDSKGQVVKSKLDEKRLRGVAEATGGFYLHLENGPATMRQLFENGLTKMNAQDIDARLSRKPIERYEWPLGAAMLALTMSILLRDRKRLRASSVAAVYARRKINAPQIDDGHRPPLQSAALVIFLFIAMNARAAVPGLDLYRDGKYADAYRSFQEDLQKNPNASAKDKMLFDAGTAAYKMRDYNKAIEAFSGALLSRDKDLQEKSHFNSGRTLEERADMDKSDDDALHDLTNAQTHYEDTLKLNPNNEAAKANLEEVKKKIDRLKHKREPTPTPTPPPQQPPQKNKDKEQDQNDQSQSSQNQQNQNQQQQQNQDQQQQQNQNQQQQSSSQNQQQQNQQQSQSQAQNNQQNQSKQDEQKQQEQAKNDQQQNKSQSQSGEGASPSPNESPQSGQDRQSPAEKKPDEQNASPSPSPGEENQNGGAGETPSPAPSASPQKKLEGEIKRADGEQPEGSPEQNAAVAEAEENKQGQMSERQAEALLRSMKDEEARVQLDEHRAQRKVYNDW